ncbi:MAG: DUF4115 domain-containing protein [Desulfitobacterium hafniense]|nr:DUF4115 domain-containing protein [Desulfitobacterium hafniense]
MAGEGKMLHEAREGKGWSLQYAEEITKIRVRYLQAMEEENYAILPGVAYIKGFLRTYSKHLGLNPEEILEMYRSSVIPEAAPTIEAPLKPIKSRPLWLRPTIATLMGVLALTIVIGVAHFSGQEKPMVTNYSPAPLPTEPKEEAAKEPAKEPATNNQATQPIQNNPANVVAAPVEADGLTAQLIFSQPCWLVVKSDGQQVLEGTYSSGTTKEIKAKEKIEFVTIGNAGGLTITLNGKAVPSLGSSGQVIRGYTLTKESLESL